MTHRARTFSFTRSENIENCAGNWNGPLQQRKQEDMGRVGNSKRNGDICWPLPALPPAPA